MVNGNQSSKRKLGEDFLNDLKLPHVDNSANINLPLGYQRNSPNSVNRKVSEYDNRGVVGSQGRLNRNYRPADPPLLKVNENRYRIESGHKNHSDLNGAVGNRHPPSI